MERISNFWRGENDQKKQVGLPPRFAEEVLNLELEVESNSILDIEIVNRLIELYSIAVEYYESIQSNKYMIFKNKIVHLLLKPTVNRIMENSSKENVLFGQEHSQSFNENEIRKKQIEHNLSYALQNTEGQVRSIISTANDRYQTISKMINNGILKQEYNLRERMKSRKGGKTQIISRQSTEGDPKETVENEQIKAFTVCQEKSTASVSNKRLEDVFKPIEINETKNLQTIQIQQKPQIKQQNRRIELKAAEIQMEKKKREQRKKNKQRKKVLTLKESQTKQQIPLQYSLPF